MRLTVPSSQIILRFLSWEFPFLQFSTNLSKSARAFQTLNLKSQKMDVIKDISDNLLLPPAHVKGMKNLNREVFLKQVSIPFVQVPVEEINVAIRKLKPIFLKLPNFPPVRDSDGKKILLLNPLFFKPDPKIDQEILDFLHKLGFSSDSSMELTLKYENFNYKDTLKAILPDELETVTGFSIVGHILHLNLKERFSDYKHIIAEVLLDKYANIQTVVNKTSTIDNTFRNFEMEVLAGKPDFQVEVKENGFKFSFDFSKVFWNPRLNHEHLEICKRLSTGDTIFDIFAGVGPFAIPAAAKKCIVHANDLNPHSYAGLLGGIKLNKVSSYLLAYNMDGRKFIQTVVKRELKKFYSVPDNNKNVHIIMNLPACALEFLDAFKNLLQDSNLDATRLSSKPIVYCYFFVKDNSEDSTKEIMINKYLNDDMQQCIKEIRDIRCVAPNKTMYRLVFTLPFSMLFNGTEKLGSTEPQPKKMRT